MNADTINNILSLALEIKQRELEQKAMQFEDQQSKETKQMEIREQKTSQLMEEISYIQSQLYNKRRDTSIRHIYEATYDALEILDPETLLIMTKINGTRIVCARSCQQGLARKGR